MGNQVEDGEIVFFMNIYFQPFEIEQKFVWNMSGAKKTVNCSFQCSQASTPGTLIFSL